MKLNAQSPLHVLLFSLVLIFQFSCSKDSDLLAEYVISETQEATDIGQFIVDDTFFIASSGSITLDVLANDTFENEEEVIIAETSTPSNGTVEINSDNTLTYTVETTEETVDTFTYSTEVVNEDASISTETGTVTVTVEDPNKTVGGELKAFPSAFGGGANATGGRGKALAIITTLDPNASLTHHAASGNHDEYYTGGFITALESSNVGYIVFDQSGNIDMGDGGTGNPGNQGLVIANKTVFGQSAPKGGITMTGGTFRFKEPNNIIFRYFRSRPVNGKYGVYDPSDDDAWTWGFLFFGGEDVIVDHCSASFAGDKAFGAFIYENMTLKRLTFSNNFAQDSSTGMYVEINFGRTGDPEEFVDDISMISNVISGINRTPNMAFDGYGEILNNVIYNSKFKNTRVYHDIRLNHIGNYFKRTNDNFSWVGPKEGTDVPVVYSKQNVYSGRVKRNSYDSGPVNLTGDPGEDNRILWTNQAGTGIADIAHFTETKHASGFTHDWTVTTPQEAYTNLITNGNVGAYQYLDDSGNVQTYRDPFDTSQLNIIATNSSYATKKSWVLPTLPSNTRGGTYDTDNDGMSDAWEISEYGNLSESYRDDFDGDGYENIEEYMNQVDFY